MELDWPESFADMIAYTTKNNPQARITIGIIRNGQMKYTVYGKNGIIEPPVEHVYEIGSISKTFTGSLLCKLIDENMVSLDDSINSYVTLRGNHYYPTFKRLVTHTSGYDRHYYDLMDANNKKKGNSNEYYGISTSRLNKQIETNLLRNSTFPYRYSNFSFSAIGSAFVGIYGNNISSVMNNFIVSDLGLVHTRVSDGSGDLGNYWKWNSDDAYIPSGGITSTISDLLEYTNMHMTESIPYLALGHRIIAEVNATSKQEAEYDIYTDAMGIAWALDLKNKIIWKDGTTSNYNSYLAFSKEKQIGVVVLSNLSPSSHIPATVLGVKLIKELL